MKDNFVKKIYILFLVLVRSRSKTRKEQKGKTGHSIDWQRKNHR